MIFLVSEKSSLDSMKSYMASTGPCSLVLDENSPTTKHIVGCNVLHLTCYLFCAMFSF